MTIRLDVRALLPVLALQLLATACTSERERPSDANPTAGAPPVIVKGEPVSCINRSQVRNTVVRSDRVIDFEMQGGKVYRNTLTSNCPGLGMDRAITYNTSTDQLCTPQIVYVLQNVGGQPRQGAGCGLGKFVPVEYERKAKAEN
ncbi:hypothetical protein [Erythrobacter tepidarius]|uniref:hypothetical protein n=1 Tax=Erythrobacter tepidarius TaxID=60454 RepID=UPI000A3BCE04|nr:hypothetical protein [Erythrobacter tepidarius]